MQLGATSGNNVAVTTGLTAGDRVVVDGILKVQPGAPVKASPLAAKARATLSRRSASRRHGRREGSAVISNFFIDRPLFATVVSAFIVIAGLAAFRALPVSMYPNIAPPRSASRRRIPGASADVIAETVAAPLEQALNGVEGMLYMRSANSSSGALQLAITFAVGTDPDIAVINVQNRVQSALPAAARGSAAPRRHGREEPAELPA